MVTTSYITPIMNRTFADVAYAREHQNDLINKNIGAWNYTDLNRICNNLKYAAEYMYDRGFLSQPYTMQIKTDWTENDIITYEQLNTMIVNNMNNLKSYSRKDLNWYSIPSIVSMDYSIANRLEFNINALATQEPLPEDTYTLTVINGSGTGEYEVDTEVNIYADPPEEGMIFDHWSGDHLENLDNPTSSVTKYTMPREDATLQANYSGTIPHNLTIITYSQTSYYNLVAGATQHIEADPAPQGKVFHHWEVEPSQYEDNLYEPAATTTFTMPNDVVTLTAVYITKGQKRLEVNNGTGTGWYEYDTYVQVSPSIPAGSTFTNWTGDIQYLTGDPTNAYNSVRIPDVSLIRIRAEYYTPPSPPVPPTENVILNVVNGTIDATGETSGSFTEGDLVSITANTPAQGDVFTYWSYSSGNSRIESGSGMRVVIKIGSTESTFIANYRTLEYHTLTIITDSGTTTTTKEKYDYFTVDANPFPSGYTFDEWTGDTYPFDGAVFKTKEPITGSRMGTSDRTITATYRAITSHTLTVKQLSGDVTYTQDEFTTVNLVAENAPAGKVFDGWSKSGPGSLSAPNSMSTTFTFGNDDTVLTPVYVNVWTVTVIDGTIAGSSSATLKEGYSYELKCRSLATNDRFDGWEKSGPGSINNLAATITSFTVGNGDTTITADISQYPDKTLTIYMRDPDTETDTLISQETYTYGSHISVIAETAPNRSTFLSWLGDVDIISPSALASSVTATMSKDATIVATYFYPESPTYYTLTVYDGYPEEGSYPAGSQVSIQPKTPSAGWEFYKWYGDTQYLVDPDVSVANNSIIMPLQSITLYAKFKVIGETPLYRISVVNGTASATYIDDSDVEHNVSGVYIDVPEGVTVTLTADPDIVGWVFDYWSGNFTSAGVDDIIVTDNPATFTSVESDLNIVMNRRELDKYTVYPTNANGPGTVYPGIYPIAGNLRNTEDYHYTFDEWTCVDADDNDCITSIDDPTSVETDITVEDRDLWATAVYTTHYKLTVVQGQDTGDGYYYEGEVVTTVYANTPATGMMFDHWEDPMGIIDNIYDPTPRIVMSNTVATITAVFTSTDQRGNSIAVTGNNLHTGIITRHNTTLVSGIFAVGTIVFDTDGCIGTITQVDPDEDDDTDDYQVNRLFYGGNF